jgi:hypothetical protein
VSGRRSSREREREVRGRQPRLPGYTLALYGHRYLENGILHMFAKSVLGRSSLAQIMIGG